MMYVLIFGGDPVTLETLPLDEADRAQSELDTWWRHNRRVGRILMAARLKAPLTATTIRFVGGRSVLRDGPFTPEHEAVGGFGIIEVTDLDEALAIACSWPAGGYVEIRPVVSPSSLAEMVGYCQQTTEGGQDR